MAAVMTSGRRSEIDPKVELAFRKKLYRDFTFFAPKALRIRTKEGQVRPFRLNRAQRYVHEQLEKQLAETGQIRALILKGRQQGMSTYVEGRYYWKVIHRKGVQAYILTHEEAASQNLYKMAQRYHELCLPQVKPSTGAANAKELLFNKLDSGYKVGTAGSKGTGRSSTLHYFHGSEVAYWPHAAEHATGVLQAVPQGNQTEIILESTANGLNNYFHTQWRLAEAGESDFVAIFVPWFWQDEYTRMAPDNMVLTDEEAALMSAYERDGLTREHLYWRRKKILEFEAGDVAVSGEARFRQEYPFTAAEAFQTSGQDTLIQPEHVLAARKRVVDKVTGAKILGVDPARYGDDSTAIIGRQGRKVFLHERHRGRSVTEVAAIVAEKLRDKQTELDTDIDMVFIDAGGLGAGVYDRLVELGFGDRVTAVNFGEKATDNDLYRNKRAEMWWDVAEWIQMEVDIPDEDALQADLCGVQFEYSADRKALKSKEWMRKQGLPSPDSGDALALTFAYPVMPRAESARRYQQLPFVPADDYVAY